MIFQVAKRRFRKNVKHQETRADQLRYRLSDMPTVRQHILWNDIIWRQ